MYLLKSLNNKQENFISISKILDKIFIIYYLYSAKAENKKTNRL